MKKLLAILLSLAMLCTVAFADGVQGSMSV